MTQPYPHVKPDLPARTRGVIALKQENCTVCYKCSRECPDWCIYIDAHKEQHDPAGGGRARSAKILDRFAIDYALCMYCGICVEVCPFDALFWSPEFEYAEYDIDLHDPREGAPGGVDLQGPAAARPRGGRRAIAGCRRRTRRDLGTGVRLRGARGGRQRQRDLGRHWRATSCTPRSTWWSRCSSVGGRLPAARRRVRRLGADPDLRGRHRDPVPVRAHAHEGADRARHARQPEPVDRRHRGRGRLPRAGLPDPGRVHGAGRRGRRRRSGRTTGDVGVVAVPRLRAAVRGRLVPAAGRADRRHRAGAEGRRTE